MENIDRMRIYWQLSAKGLLSDLIDRVRVERPTASRNTIHLAFIQGPTTPTREMIIQVADQLLKEKEPSNDSTLMAT